MIRRALRNFISNFAERRMTRFTEKREKRTLEKLGLSTSKVEGEDEHIKYWSSILRYPNKYGYRLYSHFCGKSLYVITDAAAIAINEALNPTRYRYFYSDKNNFDYVLPKDSTPETIVHVIGGAFFDREYREFSLREEYFQSLLSEHETIVVKPSVDSDSGKGVQIFHKGNNGYSTIGGDILTKDYLKSCGSNIIVQAGLKQHPDMSRFNPTSVNTLRIATYRSVKDGTVHVLSHAMRIGKSGEEVDNSHNGGAIVWINEDGVTADQCYNQWGERFNVHNGLDFANNSFVIPSFDKALELCRKIALSLPHIHLIQHDIAIDDQGNPKVIEFNCYGFSVGIAQRWGKLAFGGFVPEMVEYIKSQPEGKLYFRI